MDFPILFATGCFGRIANCTSQIVAIPNNPGMCWATQFGLQSIPQKSKCYCCWPTKCPNWLPHEGSEASKHFMQICHIFTCQSMWSQYEMFAVFGLNVIQERKKSKYIENDKLNPFGNSQNNLSKFSVKVTWKQN